MDGWRGEENETKEKEKKKKKMVKVWKMKEYNNNQRCVLSAEQVAAKKGGEGGLHYASSLKKSGS